MTGPLDHLIPRLTGVRYDVPLREGGSLPAVVETAEDGPYVVKFLGAGQGAKALVAELLTAGLARTLGLPLPAPAVVTLAEGFGAGEPDPEIQDILRGSVGENFGLQYLPGALPFDPAVDGDLDPALAAAILWFDAYTTNVDRTPRNPNLLVQGGQIWMIDHGASLFFHHNWEGWRERIQSPFPQIKDHILLASAGDLAAADARLRPLLSDEAIGQVVAELPKAWLGDEEEFGDAAVHREAYVRYLVERLNGPRRWLEQAIEAQRSGPERLVRRATHRVELDLSQGIRYLDSARARMQARGISEAQIERSLREHHASYPIRPPPGRTLTTIIYEAPIDGRTLKVFVERGSSPPVVRSAAWKDRP